MGLNLKLLGSCLYAHFSVTSEALFDYLILSPNHILIVDMVKTGRPSRNGLGEGKKKRWREEEEKPQELAITQG